MLGMLHSDAIGKLVLRLTVGGLMLFHGIDKFLHPGSVGFIGQKLEAMNLPAQLAYGVYVGELIAALMLVVGAFSRLGALLIVINMLVAISLMHSNALFSLSKHGGWALTNHTGHHNVHSPWAARLQ